MKESFIVLVIAVCTNAAIIAPMGIGYAIEPCGAPFIPAVEYINTYSPNVCAPCSQTIDYGITYTGIETCGCGIPILDYPFPCDSCGLLRSCGCMVEPSLGCPKYLRQITIPPPFL